MGEFKQNEVVNLGISPFGFQVPDDEITKYPKPGFQNAPAFCEDTDKALGTYSFNVPTDFATGEYTFVWLWAFNGAQVCTGICQGSQNPNQGSKYIFRTIIQHALKLKLLQMQLPVKQN